MSEPASQFDPAVLAAARAQIEGQAQAVAGTPSAGIFGDQASAAQPTNQQIDLSAATPAAPDPAEMLAMLQAQQAQISKMLADAEAARIAALPEPAEPPDKRPLLGNASGELKAALMGLHARLEAVEGHLGL